MNGPSAGRTSHSEGHTAMYPVLVRSCTKRIDARRCGRTSGCAEKSQGHGYRHMVRLVAGPVRHAERDVLKRRSLVFALLAQSQRQQSINIPALNIPARKELAEKWGQENSRTDGFIFCRFAFRRSPIVSKFAVILPAAGKSSRFKDPHYKKPFVPLDNRAVWLHSAERFVNRDDVGQLIVVIAPEDREEFQAKFAANTAILGIEVVEGGQHRSDSVAKALARVRPTSISSRSTTQPGPAWPMNGSTRCSPPRRRPVQRCSPSRCVER